MSTIDDITNQARYLSERSPDLNIHEVFIPPDKANELIAELVNEYDGDKKEFEASLQASLKLNSLEVDTEYGIVHVMELRTAYQLSMIGDGSIRVDRKTWESE